MNKMVKDILILTVITVVAGFLLGFFYDITKEPIQIQEEQTKQEAYRSVFAEASTFDAESSEITEALSRAASDIEAAGYAKETIEEALAARDEAGNILGYVFTVTSHEGYGGDITISMGVKLDGTVTGVEILSISETAGLGMKADEPSFKEQFANKAVAKFSYTKTGASTDYEIDALSGATITTNAMVNAVDAGLAFFADENDSMSGTNGGGTDE